MRVAVFPGKDSTEPSVVYAVVAGSSFEAAKLISDYLRKRDPWVRIDVVAVANKAVDGPARVIGPIGKGNFDREPMPRP